VARGATLMAAPGNNPPFDPLYLHEPVEHRVQLPVLGIPVRFATNDPMILSIVEDVFGHWRGASIEDPAPPGQGVDIRLFLQDGDEGPAAEPLVTFRAPDPMRWIVHTPGSFALADLERRVGVAYVTRTLLADRVRFRVSVLQFLVLIILTVEDRTPVHAAMIGSGDVAVLLAGKSGTGKSTLAYAASKAGLDVYSDDAAYIQLEPRRVWGGDPAALLLRDVAGRFPELAGAQTAMFPTGKHKMIAAFPALAGRRRWVSRAGVCVLDRGEGPVRLERIGAGDIRAILTHDPAGAGSRFGVRLEQAAAWLSAPGGWRLTLSTDPTEAVPYLKQLLKEIQAGGPDGEAAFA
jgi:hypothetical protein